MSRAIKATFNEEERYFENRCGEKSAFTESTGPYEYLLGTLAGCFYNTFRSIKPDWVSLSEMIIDVEGEKRTDIPTTLERTKVKVTVKGASDEKEIRKLIDQAAKTSSIWHTISKVSEIELEMEFL